LSPNEEDHEGDIADDKGVADAQFPPVEGGGQLLIPTTTVSPSRPLNPVEVMPPGPCDSSLRLPTPLGFDEDAAPPQREGVSAVMAGVATTMSPRTAARAPMGDDGEPPSPLQDVLAQVDGDGFQQVPWSRGRLGNNFGTNYSSLSTLEGTNTPRMRQNSFAVLSESQGSKSPTSCHSRPLTGALEQDHGSTPITFRSTIDTSFRKFFGDTSDDTLLQFHTIFQEGAAMVDKALD
jgi:hypothetical protein